jgi:carbamoyl-phosphate synthase large subunit
VPFVSTATGVPLAKIAAKVMIGRTLAELGVREVRPAHTAVKAVVLPFAKFDGVDPRLGPEMRSTGESMGIDDDFARAFAKAWIATGAALPVAGAIALHGARGDQVAPRFAALGFAIVRGAAAELADRVARGEVALVIDVADGAAEVTAGAPLRKAALAHRVPCTTTVRGALALADAIAAARGPLGVRALQTRRSA